MKKHLITGIVILLPLALTVAIVSFIFNLLTQPFVGVVKSMLSHYALLEQGLWFLSGDQLTQFVSQIVILVLLFLFTATLGLLARWFFVNAFLDLWDKLLHRIPLINTIYKTSQDVIQTIFMGETQSFKQVVLAPFPNPDILSIGLVTRDHLPMIKQDLENDQSPGLVAVFVPTTPNPTSGFLLMFEKKDLIFLDMSVEDALKYVISCGVIMAPFQGIKPEEALKN